jgi:hypothetical protein
MKKNEGKLDRIIRFILGIFCFYLGYVVFSFGILSVLFYVFGFLLVITSLTGYCGIYSIFGINTNKTCDLEKNKKDNKEN